jgi:hypothetical protein
VAETFAAGWNNHTGDIEMAQVIWGAYVVEIFGLELPNRSDG